MSIDPTKTSGSHPLIDGASLHPAASRNTHGTGGVTPGATGPAAGGAHAGDSVEISEEARGLAAAGGQTASGIPIGRFREVLARLTSGHYDTARVRDQVARRVQSDL